MLDANVIRCRDPYLGIRCSGFEDLDVAWWIVFVILEFNEDMYSMCNNVEEAELSPDLTWRWIKVLPMPSDFGKSSDEMSETTINPS